MQTFSKLAQLFWISPNCSSRDGNPIERITVHHTAGIATTSGLLALFANPARGASANYVIGNDGVIGGCVPEQFRAWTSGSYENDTRAITLEVSNDVNGEPWSIGSAAYESAVELCVDICIRHGIRLWWDPEKHVGSLTCHRWYQATACPGDWFYQRIPQFIKEVNGRMDELYARIAQLEEQIRQLSARLERDEIVIDDQTEKLIPIGKAVLPVYKTVKNMPKEYQPVIQKLVDDGSLKGTGKSLDVSELMARILTILDREGVLK